MCKSYGEKYFLNQTHIYDMYKRKRTSPSTRRRVRRRTAYRRKSMLTRNPNVSTFRLKCKSFLTNWTFSSASTIGFWRYLSLNPAILTSFAEHAAIFDEYKLYGYQYEFRPSYDGVDYNAAVASLGNMHLAVDPGSTVSPSGVYGTTTLNTFFEQSQNVKTYKCDQVVKAFVRPKVAMQVSGGGTTGRLQASPWLKTSDSFVDHRGLHVFLQQFTGISTPATMSYDIFVTFYVMFRGNR